MGESDKLWSDLSRYMHRGNIIRILGQPNQEPNPEAEGKKLLLRGLFEVYSKMTGKLETPF